MNYFFIFVFSMFFRLLHSNSFDELTDGKGKQYQDICINGKTVKKSTLPGNDCNKRFKILEKIVKQYKRPFTMLDLGAAQGYYTFRFAHSFPDSTFVMIDGNNRDFPETGNLLKLICEKNDSVKNVIFLEEILRLNQLQKLGECEHFDIVLALNVIHWFPNEWKQIIDAIVNLGMDIIIETPPAEESVAVWRKNLRKRIINHIEHAHDSKIIGKVPRIPSPHLFSNIYHIKGKRTHLSRAIWIGPKKNQYYIDCTHSHKFLIKRENNDSRSLLRTSSWTPGINMMTFLMYNGSYPDRKNIVEKIWNLRHIRHNDWLINNMILQGNKVSLIDFSDIQHRNKNTYSYDVFKKIKNILCKKKSSEVKDYYYKHIVPLAKSLKQ